MSREARDWARGKSEGLTNTAKLLLRELSEYHNVKRDLAWPSQRQLCEGTALPVRTVSRCIAALVTAGLVEIAQRANQHQPTHYRLLLPREHTPPVACAKERAHATGGKSTRQNVHEHTPNQ